MDRQVLKAIRKIEESFRINHGELPSDIRNVIVEELENIGDLFYDEGARIGYDEGRFSVDSSSD